MSTNQQNTKMMLVNPIVNQSFNFFTPPNVNTPETLMTVCWKCRCIQPLPRATQSIECDSCKTNNTPVQYRDPRSPRPPHIPKKAAVICVSYRKSSHEFKRSIEDAEKMKKLLKTCFQFSESDIVMLTEVETNPDKTPTKKNLLRELYRLGQGCERGDSLVFHYSGPGLRLRNYRLGEVDGYNETLCPMDFETQGMIFDDEINAVIVRHLLPGVKLHAIIDSCHTKSVLDLPYLYRKKSNGQYKWEKDSRRSDVLKGTSGGDAISFSGSVAVQTSAYIPLLSETTSAGSMTRGFIHAIEHLRKQEDGRELTYWGILDYMQNKYIPINATSADLKQEPLLSACGPNFKVNTPFTL